MRVVVFLVIAIGEDDERKDPSREGEERDGFPWVAQEGAIKGRRPTGREPYPQI